MANNKTDYGDIFSRGILKENPVLMLLLGTCPILAVSTTATNGLGMGIAVIVVLTMTNFIISLIRNLVNDKVRIAVYITIIAGMVTIIQMFMQAYTPDLNRSLGIFIPLITVNCIILGRAEAFAGKNGPIASAVDGLGMGLGFTLAITVMASLREIFGAGTWFGAPIPILNDNPFAIMVMPPGGFFIYGIMIAGTLAIIRWRENNAKDKARELTRSGRVTAEAAILNEAAYAPRKEQIAQAACTDGGCGSCGAAAGCGMSEYRAQMRPQKMIVPETIKRNTQGGQR